MEQIRLTLPAELLEAIDNARGDVPRVVWIRRAIENRLKTLAFLAGTPDEHAH